MEIDLKKALKKSFALITQKLDMSTAKHTKTLPLGKLNGGGGRGGIEKEGSDGSSGSLDSFCSAVEEETFRFLLSLDAMH